MIIRRKACVAGLIWILWSIPAHSQCTGSGTTWSCPAGATSTQVEAAINSASDGATITFAPGTYTVTAIPNQVDAYMVSQSKGVTLVCATPPNMVGAATVNACQLNAARVSIFGSDRFSGTNTHFYRLSGFIIDLQATAPSYGTLYWDTYNGASPGSPATVTQIRVDHNTFQNGTNGAQTTLIGSEGQQIQVYGVYDHNLYTGSSQMAVVIWAEGPIVSPPASQLGTANNLFLENNTLDFTAVGNSSAEGCTDGWGGSAYVVRYNTSTDCLWAVHGVTHAGGPANYEFYNNTVIMDAGSVRAGEQDCYRCFHSQGAGEFIAFNNSFTAYSGKNSEVISMLHYRDYPNGVDGTMPADAAQCNGTVNGPADDPLVIDQNRSPQSTYYGYACWRQPGRDPATMHLMPMYVWNNYWSDTLAQVPLLAPDLGGSPDYYSEHMQANREWYNAVSASAQTSPTSPFNGTTGMGFGTLTNRPTTCTTNPNESGGGVGYFATDQGPQGTLYQCSSTNTWTVFYTPYTYPHPLTQGGGDPPAPPTNLTAVSQ